jgi:hypothetical protein
MLDGSGMGERWEKDGRKTGERLVMHLRTGRYGMGGFQFPIAQRE